MENQNTLDFDNLISKMKELPSAQKTNLLKMLQKDCQTKKRKRNEYTEDFKRKAVDLWKTNRNYSLTAELLNEQLRSRKEKENEEKKNDAENNDEEDTEKMSCIDESYIRRWVSEKLDPDEIKKTLKKVKKSKTKPGFIEMEEELMVWFRKTRESKLSITLRMIREEALSIFEELKKKSKEPGNEKLVKYKDSSFSASNGWFRRFKRRNRISRRVCTHTAQKLCDNYAEEIHKFLGRVTKQRYYLLKLYIKYLRMEIEHFKARGDKKLLIFNMDEVPVYYDMCRNKTYHFSGDRSVSIIRTNGQKKRLTVCLAVSSDGKKLPPYVIFKKKSKVNYPYLKSIVATSNENGWITEKLMEDWHTRIWKNTKLESSQLKMLILDKCSSHQKESVRKAITDEGSYIDFIPAGCTSLCQPLDLVINKPFKDSLRRLYEDWMKNEGTKPSNKTKLGYLKAPSDVKILKWIRESWNKIDEALIIKSFKYAGTILLIIMFNYCRS